MRAPRRRALPLLYLDCDEFKAVNDRMAHPTRNRLLARIAATLKENIRALDVVARLGGDKFAVLLVETPAGRGDEVAARLQKAMRFVLGPAAPSVTFSIGAMTFDSPPTSPTEAFRVADALMYEAKRAGKDRMVHAVTS